MTKAPGSQPPWKVTDTSTTSATRQPASQRTKNGKSREAAVALLMVFLSEDDRCYRISSQMVGSSMENPAHGTRCQAEHAAKLLKSSLILLLASW